MVMAMVSSVIVIYVVDTTIPSPNITPVVIPVDEEGVVDLSSLCDESGYGAVDISDICDKEKMITAADVRHYCITSNGKVSKERLCK